MPIQIIKFNVSSVAVGPSSGRNMNYDRNVRLYNPFWQYTNLFIFRFVLHKRLFFPELTDCDVRSTLGPKPLAVVVELVHRGLNLFVIACSDELHLFKIYHFLLFVLSLRLLLLTATLLTDADEAK